MKFDAIDAASLESLDDQRLSADQQRSFERAPRWRQIGLEAAAHMAISRKQARSAWLVDGGYLTPEFSGTADQYLW
jgi:hypothetical protein